MSFSTFALRPELVQTVAELGYTHPTPIQSALIPVLLEGQDAMGQAQTGTGKTAAYALPLLNRLQDGMRGAVQALVLVPTRELATQVSNNVFQYGRALGARVLPVYGGQPYHRQVERLRKGTDVVVGTPGRLLDLINQGALDLSAVQTVVLDEADEMLSMGFIEDIEAILSATPAERQTAVLSATFPAGVRRIASRYQRNPLTCTVEAEVRSSGTITQRAYLVHDRDKVSALCRLIEVEDMTAAIVFTQTRQATSDVAYELQRRGFVAEALSGEMSQSAREDVLRRLRKQEITFLVATDVASRGLDIDHLSHVINFDLSLDPEVYVHRIGRTGRAGRSGTALTLVAPRQKGLLRRVEQFTGNKLPIAKLPTEADIRAHRDAQVLSAMRSELEQEPNERMARLVASLLDEGHDPLFIATAALRLATRDEDARPIPQIEAIQMAPQAPRENRVARTEGRHHPHKPDRPAQATSRDEFEPGMVRLRLPVGQDSGIRTGTLINALTRNTGMPGRDIGKILIRQTHTLVDVPERHASRVLAGSYQIGHDHVTLQRA